jgi:hypothetical protein
MPRALAPALLLTLVAAHGAAEVRVLARGPHIDLTATAAPLTEVLDRLGRQVGLKVQYEGPAPRQLVTLSLRDRTPAEAVLSVLEGQGVNFALVWDETGTRLQTLVIAGSAGVSTAASAPARTAPEPAPRRTFGMPSPNVEPPDPGFEPEPDDAQAEPQGSGLPDTGAPAFGPPGSDPGAGVPQGAPPAVQAAPQQQFPVSPFAPQAPAPQQTQPPATGMPPPSQGQQPPQ